MTKRSGKKFFSFNLKLFAVTIGSSHANLIGSGNHPKFSGEDRHARRLINLEKVTYDDIAAIRNADPAIAQIIDKEAERQADGIELSASENFASCAVRAAQDSVLTNKYAEGYPGKRYYNGCEFIDEIESLAIERACKLFGAEAANVQPHSGSSAACCSTYCCASFTFAIVRAVHNTWYTFSCASSGMVFITFFTIGVLPFLELGCS